VGNNSRSQPQRKCQSCGHWLAADNHGELCSPCERQQHAASDVAPEMPREFWERPSLKAAFATPSRARRFGAVLRAYYQERRGEVTQAQIAKWLGVSQVHVSRIMRGRCAVTDLEKLDPWAQALRIPQHYLWFTLSSQTSDVSTEQAPEPNLSGTSDSANSGDSASEGDNMRRRELLTHGPAAGLAVIADSSAAAGGTATAGRTISIADVEAVHAVTNTFRGLYSEFGAGNSRFQANEYLTAIVDPMVRNGRYTDTVQEKLFSATAELNELIGAMAYDTGQALIGQRHNRDGLRLCQEVGNDALAAEIWGSMGYEAALAGAGEAAVDLALAAQQSAKRTAIGPLRSKGSLMEARGLALQGDKTGGLAALRKAEQEFVRGNAGHDAPPWLSYFDESYLAAAFALVFQDLRLPEEAERFARRSLETADGNERVRLIRTTVLATVLADQHRIDEACATAMLAVDKARSIRSTRTVVLLGDVARRLTPFRTTPEVRELYEHMVAIGIAVP
jgi:transcriptional regulator with XRE-family HTH domain